MIAGLLIPLPRVGAVAWAVFRFAPKHASRETVLWFNRLSLIVAFLLAAAAIPRTFVIFRSGAEGLRR